MLSSYLISQRKDDAASSLFCGCDFVPDIPSLQSWLEIAWERGFDVVGSNHFNRTVYGSTKWVGTTECAALFRSFGFRARVVDFGPKDLESLFLSVPDTSSGGDVKNKGIQVSGPMDKYLIRKKRELDYASPSESGNQFDGRSGNDKSGMKGKGHQVLMDWVWNYFSDKTSKLSGHGRVIISHRSYVTVLSSFVFVWKLMILGFKIYKFIIRPLYFQHDGHSRTIVGIQAKKQQNGIQQYNLLILDPGHVSIAFEKLLIRMFCSL